MKKRIPVFLALLMLLSSLLVGAQGEAASVRLDSQSGHWALPAGIALSGSTLKLPYGGVAVYTGQEVGDEYVEYTQRIEAPGTGSGCRCGRPIPRRMRLSRTAICSGLTRPWCSCIKPAAANSAN